MKTTEPVERSPLDKFFDLFHPRGGTRNAWALVNLISLIVTVYLFLPLLHLKAKFGRAAMMGKVNGNEGKLRLAQSLSENEARDKARLLELAMAAGAEGDVDAAAFNAAVEQLFYRVERFRRRFWSGIALELVFVVLAIVAFLLTENMRLPMVLIDRFTPLMLLLLLIVWILDVRLIRYRDKVQADEEEAERRLQEQEAAED